LHFPWSFSKANLHLHLTVTMIERPSLCSAKEDVLLTIPAYEGFGDETFSPAHFLLPTRRDQLQALRVYFGMVERRKAYIHSFDKSLSGAGASVFKSHWNALSITSFFLGGLVKAVELGKFILFGFAFCGAGHGADIAPWGTGLELLRARTAFSDFRGRQFRADRGCHGLHSMVQLVSRHIDYHRSSISNYAFV
jgi:hypothetical protein